jgi:hypothetical protein
LGALRVCTSWKLSGGAAIGGRERARDVERDWDQDFICRDDETRRPRAVTVHQNLDLTEVLTVEREGLGSRAVTPGQPTLPTAGPMLRSRERRPQPVRIDSSHYSSS